MRRLILLALPIAAIGGLVVASGHPAAAASHSPLTPSVSGTFTDKPYTATTPDSGTGGNNWAIDLYTRSFVISPTALNGTTTVVEHFNNGRFISLGDGATGSAASPGAGDPGNAGHMLREGVVGSFTGTFTIVVNAGFTYHSGNACGQVVSLNPTDDGCTTGQWIALAFPGATYGTDTNTTAYSLTYKATGNGLHGNTWTDASAGDSGDIFTSP